MASPAGKNILPYPYCQGTRTLNGVTFTVNNDGTVVVNGTATADTTFLLQGWSIDSGSISLDTDERYTLSGCPEGGSTSTYALCMRAYPEDVTPSSSTGNIGRDTGNGYTLTNSYAYVSPYIAVWSGATVSDLVFKPMLRLASNPDDSWEPFINADAIYSYHGFNDEGEIDYDADGWVQWNGNTITIPHGLWINPKNTMPYDTAIYNVYRTNDGTFHDVVFMASTNTWEANTYSSTGIASARSEWVWNETTDVVLSQYTISSYLEIYSAQLFTPPKKYSELAEVGIMHVNELNMLLDQEEVFNRLTNNGAIDGLFMENGQLYIKAQYIKSTTLTLGGTGNENGDFRMLGADGSTIGEWDNNGLRGEWFEFNSDSESAVIGRQGDDKKNVHIDSDSVDIRQGQEILASFGETTVIGKTGATDAHVDTTGSKMSFKVGIDEVAYIGVDPETLKSMFYVGNATILDDLQFGNWQWKNRDNGNLSLKWVGGE